MEEGKPAKFNQALAKLERIDTIHRSCHEYRWARDYVEWEIRLRSLYSELYERMNIKDLEIIEDLFRIARETRIKYVKGSRIQALNPGVPNRNALIYEEILDKIEKFIYKKEYQYRLSIADDLTPEDALGV